VSQENFGKGSEGGRESEKSRTTTIEHNYLIFIYIYFEK
jgi:hypothetical protein